MPITKIVIPNIGFPSGDPACPLNAVLFVPDPTLFSQPFHCVVGTHAPGFTGGDRNLAVFQTPFGDPAIGLASKGFLCLAFQCRQAKLDNGSGGISGQTTTGRWHQQTDDIKQAIRYMRPGAEIETIHGFTVTGSVGTLGPSGGAHHAVYAALDGTPGDDKADWAIGCSTPTDFSDDASANFVEKAVIYGDSTDPATLLARSPIALALVGANPILVYNGTTENMPYSQLTRFTTAMEAAGAVGYEPHTNSTATNKSKHAFTMWTFPQDDGVIIGEYACAWAVARAAEFGGTPPPPEPMIMRGASILTPSGTAIDEPVLADPNVDSIGLNLHWYALETTEGTYDFDYLDTEVSRISAAGKRCILRVTTMGGSFFFSQGNTPNWVFTAIGNTAAGYPGSITDATLTNGSPTVTSPTADFTSADLHSEVDGNGIPGAPTYVGIVTDTTSIELSSSASAHVPVNATGDFAGNGNIQLLARPRAAYDMHDTVPGVTYSYTDPNIHHQGDPETTIPVYWEPTFLAKKKRMLNALGDHITNGVTLTQAEKNCIAVIGIAYANAQTEDWNIPDSDDIDTGKTLTRLELWLNSPTDPDPALRGAGYTTQKMIDAAVKRGHEIYTDGQTYTNNRLTSNTANFTFADVGKQVQGLGIPANTLIAEWTNNHEVQLDKATTATASGLTIQIRSRDTGIYDIAIAAFPGQLVTSAIGANVPELDEAAATAAGDTDPSNYLARTVTSMVNEKYPALCIAQKNSLSAKIPTAPGNKSWRLLWDIHASGNYVAAQDLWYVYNDPAYRMNGGNPGDYTEISNAASTKLFGYGGLYREIYNRDVTGTPAAIKFCHDLLNPAGGGGPPPPPPPTPIVQPPFHAPIRTTPLFEMLETIASHLGIDPTLDLSQSIARTWVSAINRHCRFAWEFWPWPELFVTEERPFRTIWTPDDQYHELDEVFFLDTWLYYQAFPGADPPIGTVPSDVDFWAPMTTVDRYVQLDQRCRQAIGQLLSVYPTNPYAVTNDIWAPCWPVPAKLPFTTTERGIEVPGASGSTVFLHYKMRPSRFTAQVWDNARSYNTGELAYGTDGETHRTVVPNTGKDPANPANTKWWAVVPLPYVISEYVGYMVAGDMAESQSQKAGFRADAQLMLMREVDKTLEQDPNQRVRYRLTRARPSWDGLPWVSSDASSAGGASLTTLTPTCVTPAGDPL